MHEVAESTFGASGYFVLTATRFAEIGDRAEFSVDWLTVEPTIIQIVLCLLGVLLPHELHTNISDEVLSNILTDVDLLDLSVFSLHFDEHLLVEVVKVSLLFVVSFSDLIKSVCLTYIYHWIVIEVFQNDCRRKRRRVMRSGALVSVTACSGLEKKMNNKGEATPTNGKIAA